MIKVVILGSGNVATHLINAFSQAQNISIEQVYSRRKKSLERLEKEISTTTDLNTLKKADIYIVAIADDAIKEFSSQLQLKDVLVVHTSGSVSMDSLKGQFRSGVFYPVQTFTKDSDVNFKNIPICLEAQHKKDLIILEELASSISNETYFIDSEQRNNLHIAAVFVNNFTNHMYHIGHQICAENTLPFQTLKPLIEETAKKITHTFPRQAQTGPARRNDKKTIQKHLEHLSKDHREIYKTITESITKTYE